MPQIRPAISHQNGSTSPLSPGASSLPKVSDVPPIV
jgi:hypothetical protein